MVKEVLHIFGSPRGCRGAVWRPHVAGAVSAEAPWPRRSEKEETALVERERSTKGPKLRT